MHRIDQKVSPLCSTLTLILAIPWSECSTKWSEFKVFTGSRHICARDLKVVLYQVCRKALPERPWDGLSIFTAKTADFPNARHV